ncbi:hypothetical protein ACQZV8_16750 [Magnetococcales bacterium HHB-1]
MSFFKSIKKAVNFVTGGGAEVTLDFLDAPNLQTPFRVQVSATATQALDVEKAYIELLCQEEIETERVNRDGEEEEHEQTRTLFSETWPISGAFMMQEGERVVFETEIDLSSFNLPPSYEVKGWDQEYEIEWKIFAGLDVPGNDPDSGWIEFKMGVG